MPFFCKTQSWLSTIVFTACFAAISNNATAQKDNSLQESVKNVFKIGILPDLYQPAIPIYYEHFFIPGLSLQTGFSYLLPLFHEHNWKMTGFNFRLSEEARRYIAEGRFYHAIEMRYLYAKYNTEGSYAVFDNQGDETIFRENLLIRKRTLSFIPKMGYHFVNEHFSFDMWIGAGAKIQINSIFRG